MIWQNKVDNNHPSSKIIDTRFWVFSLAIITSLLKRCGQTSLRSALCPTYMLKLIQCYYSSSEKNMTLYWHTYNAFQPNMKLVESGKVVLEKIL